MSSYKIVRNFADHRRAEVLKTGLTLEEARVHCRRDDTHCEGVWFDGYERDYGPQGPSEAEAAKIEADTDRFCRGVRAAMAVGILGPATLDRL